MGYGFPIPSGQVDAATLAGRINHTGGLRFVNLANGKKLSLTKFRIVIDAHPHLTAIVNGDPKVRVSILRLDLSKATVSKPLPYVRVGNVGAYLNSTAAGALNHRHGRVVLRPRHQAGHGVRQRARRRVIHPRRVSADLTVRRHPPDPDSRLRAWGCEESGRVSAPGAPRHPDAVTFALSYNAYERDGDFDAVAAAGHLIIWVTIGDTILSSALVETTELPLRLPSV